jgi:hypothetical protein
MAIVERLRGIRDGLAAARALGGRLRRGGDAPDGAAISGTDGPGAPPRQAARRPDEDPALLARLTRWRSHDGPPAAVVAAVMSSRERSAAMHDLMALRGRLAGDQAALIDAALAEDAVTVRRLGPQDGHVWQLPGMRVFAIVGVQAFTVRDEAPPGL